LLDDFEHAGSGDTIAPQDTSSSADTRSDHAQDRAAESANPRSAERSQDAGTPRASGKSVGQMLREQFALAKSDPDRLHADAQAAYDGAGPTVADAETRRRQDRDERGRYRGTATGEAPAAAETPSKPRSVSDTLAGAITEHSGTPVQEMEIAGRKFTPNPVSQQIAAIGTTEQRAMYDALPTAARAHFDSLWNKRNNDFSKAYKEKHDQAEIGKPYASIFEPHRDWFKQIGRTGPEVAQRAMETVVGLAQTDRQKAEQLWWELGREFQIPSVVQHMQQPQQANFAPQGDYVSREQAQQMANDAVAQYHRDVQIADDIKQSTADFPHFEEAKSRMGELIKQYPSHFWDTQANKPHFQALYQHWAKEKGRDGRTGKEIREASRALAEHKRQQADDARRASVGIASRAPTTTNASPANRSGHRDVPSVRDRLEEAIRQHA
jgi:hypothetical protein